MQPAQTIDAVRSFWDSNPLWSGETEYPVGSRDYFDEHRKVCIEDCFAGSLDERIFPEKRQGCRILDLGCGPGFWTVELGLRGYPQLVAADLSSRAVELARKRCELYDVSAEFTMENAEQLTFADETFSHVNCQGVIHHTPDTQACVREIWRVLQPGGTACLSVYYRNLLLRLWPILCRGGKIIKRLGVTLKGRGREDLFALSDPNGIVRLYDGRDNPIGKCYTRSQLVQLVSPYFEIVHLFYHFFPARVMPFKTPTRAHRFLDRRCPFMIYAFLRKR